MLKNSTSPTPTDHAGTSPTAVGQKFFWGALPFVATPDPVVHRMLEVAHVGRSDTVMDLGCGDGRILLSALKDFGAKMAIGYELREDLIDESLKALRSMNLEGRAKIIKGDLIGADLSEATVITIYLSGTGSQMLRSKFEGEVKKGTRIVSHGFAMEGWRSARVDVCSGHKIFLYEAPRSFKAGGWAAVSQSVRSFAHRLKLQ